MPYDAVVIGAGVNGLAAAVHLAAKGWKVAVVERADVAGGAVKTREITRPGFRHDLYAMNLGLFAGSPFFATHKDRLFAQGLGFVTAEHCFASAFPDGTWLGVEKNPEANAQRIAALSAADADRWRAIDGGVRARRAAHFRAARRADAVVASRAHDLCRLAGARNRLGRRHGAPARFVAARMARREFRERQAQGHAGGVGHAS